MKLFFKVLKGMLEMLSWVSGGLFFNAIDAVLFSGTAVSWFAVVKMAMFVVVYFTLKELVSYIESEWDRISSDEYKKEKKKLKNKSITKKVRFRKVKGFGKRNLKRRK